MSEEKQDGLTIHEVAIARMDERIKHIEANYVTQQEFQPIRIVVFGMVGGILLACLTTVLNLILRSTH